MNYLVQHYFESSARRFPDKPAVACREDVLSYRELDERSNALARHLIVSGVERGARVPFFMSKGVQSIISLLGILKADCAYVPLDVNSPGPRIQAILESTGTRHVIVNEASCGPMETIAERSGVQVINLDRIDSSDSRPRDYENLSIDLAYVLFTSGSTGTPKGVMIPHRAIIDYIDWCVECYELGPDDLISNHAPLYFDNSTFDIYTAFKSGATLHLVPDELNLVIPRLVTWIRQKEITTFFCVPSVLTMLHKSRRLKPDSFPALRHLIFAGEVVRPDVLKAWMELYPEVQFTNMYGPTEITVDCTYHRILQPQKDEAAPVPIGIARPNMEVFVRGEEGALSKNRGAEGELLVRGTSVAHGYLGDPDRTAASFIQNPLHDDFHDPLYCTGDLVRIDEDDRIQFVGRVDDQIKFLGYRIELGEIEAALNSVDSVGEAIVVFNQEATQEEQEIVALVLLHEAVEESAVSLREKVAERLPAYMVPARVVFHKGAMPRTANGKYDRKAAKSIVYRNQNSDD